MTEKLYAARVPVFFGGLAAMLAAESLRPARPWRTPRGRRLRFHLGLSVFNSLAYRLLAGAPLLLWVAYVHGRGWGAVGLWGLSGLPEVLTTLVVCDGWDYWWHRFNHRVPLLWRFHKVHHMDTHVDATTSLRFHIGELLLSAAAKAGWVLIWGPSVLAFAVFETAITLFAQFHHANVDFPDRVERAVRLVHMTPRLHAAHHTVSLRTRDNNFSTVFLWWDRLFGTFREADYREMETLGLPEGRETYLSFKDLLLWPARPAYHGNRRRAS